MKRHVFIATVFITAACAISAFGQTTQFTYQGRLTDNSLQPTALYDMQFRLFDDPDAGEGTQHGSTILLLAIQVTNGVFTVKLNFNSPPCATCFTGAARYLEVGVRPANSGSYTILAPRHEITSTPYAIKSINADTATTADTLDGINSTAFLQTSGGTITGPVTMNTTLSVSGATTLGSTLNVTGNATFSGNGSFTGPVLLSSGTVSAPSLSFTGDTNTGMFRSAADRIDFSTGGISRLQIDNLGRVGIKSPTTSDGQLTVWANQFESCVGIYLQWTNAATTPCNVALSVAGAAGTAIYAQTLSGTPLQVNKGGAGGNLAIFQSNGTTVAGIGSAGNFSGSAFDVSGNGFVGGRLGIGQLTPAHPLVVSSSTDPTIRIETGGDGFVNPTLWFHDPFTGGNAAGFKIVYENNTGLTRFDSLYDDTSGDIVFRTRVAGTPVNALTINGTGSVEIPSGVSVGGGGVVTNILTRSITLDFPNTLPGTSSDVTVAVTGAADGDAVSLGVPNASTTASGFYTAWVSSSNTVTVRFLKIGPGSADPPSGTFKIVVTKF